ncbi:MAG: AI-2E family transporter [Planctomycetaceae bacterium]|nr:AI-2E family transporter [Planctomycetaceae bacterium]
MVRIVSLSVLLTLIVILGLTFFQVLAPFILPLFLAGVFTILSQPLFRYFIDRTKNRVRLAAGLTTGTIVASIMIPVTLATVLASLQLYVVATRLSDRDWTKTYRDKTDAPLQYVCEFLNARLSESRFKDDDDTEEAPADENPYSSEETAPNEDETPPPDPETPPDPDALPIDLPPGDQTDVDASAEDVDLSEKELMEQEMEQVRFTPTRIRKQVGDRLKVVLQDIAGRSLGGETFDFLSSSIAAVVSAIVSFLVFVIALYYFLADGTALLNATQKLIPVHAEYQREMLDEFSKVVRSVVMATFFAGLVQGIATVAALWVFKFDHLLVLLALSVLSSLVPLLGTWLVWGPCALWLLWNGHWVQALLLALYGAIFVGMLDNVVRTYVLNSNTKLHPLLAFISVLGGLQTMGLWGMFVGPIVASCLHALVKIFNHELTLLSEEKFAVKIESTGDAESTGSPVEKGAPTESNGPASGS